MRPGTLVFLAWILAGCSREPEPRAIDPHAELSEFIESEMRSGSLPGLAAAAIMIDPSFDTGSIAWTGAFGEADIEARRKVDDTTPFLVASLSKTIVSVLLMQLVEEGIVSLDESVEEKFGFVVKNPNYPDRAITPRMLATHTSGIVDDWITLARETTKGDADRSLEEFARDYAGDADHFVTEPGTELRYSNAAFAMLGAFVEAARGEPLPEVSRRRVFDPLGMADTGWLLREMDVDRLAVPYGGTEADGFVRNEHQGFSFYPATSLRTSVRDLSHFMMAFMRHGMGSEGRRILSEESALAMRASQVPLIDDTQGIGFYYETIDGRRYVGHSGAATGASALMFARDDAVGLVVLSNSDAFIRGRFGNPEGSDAMYAIIEQMARETW